MNAVKICRSRLGIYAFDIIQKIYPYYQQLIIFQKNLRNETPHTLYP